jgi:hypothetical protein
MIPDKVFIKTQFSFLEEIQIEDLESIIKLRSGRSDSVLSKISNKVSDQKIFYKNYKLRREKGEEIYFKIFAINSKKIIGLVRLTEMNNSYRFNWESFVMNKKSAPHISVDVNLTLFKIGYFKFKRDICGPWIVPIKGINVLNFHKKIGISKIILKTKIHYVLISTVQLFNKKIKRYEKMGFANILESNI